MGRRRRWRLGFQQLCSPLISGSALTGASSAAVVPAAANGNFQHLSLNGSLLTGAWTFLPPTTTCLIVVEILNGGSGAVGATLTTSSYTKVTGDTWASANGNKYAFFVTKMNSYSAFAYSGASMIWDLPPKLLGAAEARDYSRRFVEGFGDEPKAASPRFRSRLSHLLREEGLGFRRRWRPQLLRESMGLIPRQRARRF